MVGSPVPEKPVTSVTGCDDESVRIVGVPEGLSPLEAAFQRQLNGWRALGRRDVPILTLEDVPEPQLGCCISCGQPARDGRWRCDLCREAAYVALGVGWVRSTIPMT